MSNNQGVWCSKCYGDHYTNDCPEPVAPVEAKEKERRYPTGGDPKDFCICDHHEMCHANYSDMVRACNQTGCDCRSYQLGVAEPKPTPSGVEKFFGKWPGDETDHELIASLDEIRKSQPDSSSIPSMEPSDMQKQLAHDDGLIATLQEDTKRLRNERAEWQRKYFELSRALSGTIDRNGDLIKRIQWLEHEKDEIRNSKAEARDSSSISTERTFDGWFDAAREFSYYQRRVIESADPLLLRLFKECWNAAKGQSNGR